MKYLNQYIQLKNSNENIEELLFLSIPLLSKVVLEKDYYEHNPELKIFTDNVFNKEYSEYLYGSRPLLYSRLIKELLYFKKEDVDKFYEIQTNFINFLSNTEKNLKTETEIETDKLDGVQNKSKKRRTNKKVIDDWRSIIDS